MKFCCANCFGDRGLSQIIGALSSKRGKCSYCGSDEQQLVHPQSLGEVFGPVTNIYEEDRSGKTLVEWFRQDWALFEHPKMDDPLANSLLGDVFDNGEIVRRRFVPTGPDDREALNRWERLCEELMYANRYFPEAHIDLDRLEELLAFLRPDHLPECWYRARIENGAPFSIDQMGPPPKRAVSHGRANPPGIPYLYLASDPKTAVAEVRPHTGEMVCVADFSIDSGKVSIVDLRHPRKIISPFALGDESAIAELRSDIAFLDRLGEELTRPIIPQSASIDYVPSQYLCEFIKKSGKAGVIYRSAVLKDGINLALFRPGTATPGSVKEYQVGRVIIDIEPTPPSARSG